MLHVFYIVLEDLQTLEQYSLYAFHFFLLINLPLKARACLYSSHSSGKGSFLNFFFRRQAFIWASLHFLLKPGIDLGETCNIRVDASIALVNAVTSASTC